MDRLRDLRAALVNTSELCRNGGYKNFRPVTIGDTHIDIGGRKTGRRRYWLRDLLRFAAAGADELSLDPGPVLALLQPVAVADLPAAVAAAITLVDRIALRRQRSAADRTPADQDQHVGTGTADGYLSAAEVLKILPDQFSGYNALRRHCERKNVPTQKPGKNRLLIHAAKLLASLGSDDDQNNKELVGIVERYAQIREKKDRLAGK